MHPHRLAGLPSLACRATARARTRALALAAAAAAVVPASARAQEGGDIDLSAFHPAMDSRGFVTVNASETLAPGQLSFGLVTTWGRNLLRFTSGPNSYQVQNLITPTLVGAGGLRILGIELELGVSLPFSIMSGDRAPDSDAGTPSNPNDDLRYQFDGQGLGDAALHLKWCALSGPRAPDQGGGLGLALVASLSLPTASESGRWLGDGHAVPELLGVADVQVGRVRLAANAGLRWRPSGTARFADDQSMMGATPVPITGGVIAAGSSIPFGVGASWALVPEHVDVVSEVYGEIPLGGEDWFPAEAIGGLKLYLARSSYLSFGAGAGLLPGHGGSPDLRGFLGIVFEPTRADRDGDGIPDDADQCPDDPEDIDGFQDDDGCPDPDNDRDGILDPDDRCPDDPEDKDGFEDEDGCPDRDDAPDSDHDGIPDHADACPDDPEDKDGFQDDDGCPDPDNDHDGILDVDDLCPDDPEDLDGFEDQDGCPDPDNDHDGILDHDDACPRVDGETIARTAEVYNNYQDDDGCPDRHNVLVTHTHLDLLDKIHFEYDSAVIQKRSYPILDSIAVALEHNPDILLVEIQGHTDERGSDAYNLDLSDRRAAAVRSYLVDHGITPGRLESQGYGETQPLDKRHTERAWSKNRRVEFLIVKRTPARHRASARP